MAIGEMFLWTRFIWPLWGPYAFAGISIRCHFFILCLTSFVICCIALFLWYFFTFRFVKRDLFTFPFTTFYLLASLLIMHPTFLFGNFFTNLDLFCPTWLLWNLPTLFDLEIKIKLIDYFSKACIILLYFYIYMF